jgi:hypothetical protein
MISPVILKCVHRGCLKKWVLCGPVTPRRNKDLRSHKLRTLLTTYYCSDEIRKPFHYLCSVARRNKIVPQYLHGNYRTYDVNEIRSCVITVGITLSMNNTHIIP